jgi:hypothetical protein
MSSYNDSDTDSGNTIVRHFCGTCGSALFSVRRVRPAHVRCAC